MSLNSVRVLGDAADGSNTWQSFFYKTTGPNVGGRWVDTSVGSGIPVYQAYVGSQFQATPVYGEGNRGIYAGPTPPVGLTKYLHAMSIGTAGAGVPAHFMLCDYLMFYPLVDGDDADPQAMDNALTLPRYIDGHGVRLMCVIATPTANSVQCTVNYTNSNGVASRIVTFGVTASGNIGLIGNTGSDSIVGTAVSPFAPLANGDKGIRSIESVTFLGGAGGFVNFVLVKPLAQIQIFEANTQAEKTFFNQNANVPEIKEGAYLNMIALLNTTNYTPLRGWVQFVSG
jgi:hypothetical protein